MFIDFHWFSLISEAPLFITGARIYQIFIDVPVFIRFINVNRFSLSSEVLIFIRGAHVALIHRFSWSFVDF